MQQPSKHLHADDLAIAGLLTPVQLEQLGQIALELDQVLTSIHKVNNHIRQSGLPMRFIPYHIPVLSKNDISVITFAHERAEKAIEAACMFKDLQK